MILYPRGFLPSTSSDENRGLLSSPTGSFDGEKIKHPCDQYTVALKQYTASLQDAESSVLVTYANDLYMKTIEVRLFAIKCLLLFSTCHLRTLDHLSSSEFDTRYVQLGSVSLLPMHARVLLVVYIKSCYLSVNCIHISSNWLCSNGLTLRLIFAEL